MLATLECFVKLKISIFLLVSVISRTVLIVLIFSCIIFSHEKKKTKDSRLLFKPRVYGFEENENVRSGFRHNHNHCIY